MKIDSIYMKDFRGIQELELSLEGKSTVLFGINGVGKSTVLSAINLLYANIINRIVKQRFKQVGNLELLDIKHGKASASISAEFSFGDENDNFRYHRTIFHDKRRVHSVSELDELIKHYEETYIGKTSIDNDNKLVQEKQDFNLPIFVNYGVNRLVLKTPLRIRKGEDYGQYSAFEKAIENQIAFGKLFEWFLEQEMYEVQMQKQDKQYQDKSLMTVKTAMVAMLDGYEDVHITVKPYSMKVTKEGEVLDILQLSDGEKCTLALFGDIARRLALANPALDNPLLGAGVVLIDELELHMHTLWQRKVISVLKDTFPNVQFIITTHSPQILGELNNDYKIFALSKIKDGVIANSIESLYGLDSNAVLEDILSTDSISQKIKEKVNLMYRCLEEKKYNEAEVLADLIDEMTLQRNPDTVRARIFIKKARRMHAQD